jgi:ATP-binding cassette subfamily B protein
VAELASDGRSLPAAWDASARAQLTEGERALAWVETDLDERLFYATGLVLLTGDRLLSAAGPSDGVTWRSWPLEAGLELRTEERGGVGGLELVGPSGRLAQWRYTAARSAEAGRVVQRLAIWRAERAGSPPPPDSTCPSCGAVVRAEDGRCPACASTPTPASASALLRLFSFARPHVRLMLLGFCLTTASTAAGLVPPYLTMPLLDRVLIPRQNGQPVDFGLVAWYLGGLAGAAVAAMLLDWGRLYVLSRGSERVSADLRSRTYAHLQRLSLEFFGGKRTGDLMSRISSDSERLCNFLSLNLVDFATDVLMILMTAAILLTLDWPLALAALCPFPVIVWLVYRVRGRLLSGYRQAGAAWGALTSVLADAIPGIRVVKAFAQEQREIDRFDRANDRVFGTNDRLNRVWSLFGPLVTLLTATGLLIVWAFACYRVSFGALTVGVLTAFLAYMARFYARVESMIRMASSVQRAAASSQRIFEILDRSPSVPEPTRPVEPGRLKGRIELAGVRFKYGAREVLHGLDLVIEPGEMVGLVGPSGAGKTTLINLICRFYDVAAGAVLVDGCDVRSFPVEAYRKNIGVVLQDAFLFYGTVADNIAYGRPGATREEVVAAARSARAHEFILRLPNGYDSVVGERGQALSGGERQRISIARALLTDPRLLILDEATSSVDTETEREIQAALDHLVRGRTTIAIAHRLSTLRRADRLVVMDRGRIAEVGRHDALIEAGGIYARLHRAQMEILTG